MRTTIALAACAAFALGGCAANPSADSYSQGQAQREMSVRMGVVDSVRPVTLEGNQSGTGTLVGGALGGIAGSNIGGGNRGSAVGTILGAVGGAIAGTAIEEGATKKTGLEITVRFDNGTMSAITQAADEQFRPGDRVRVLSGGGVTRVTH
ncbi:MAG TPA: glycine zipper 2TM domain-containing protein [Rhodocyclaceae bacterium]|nr:glycine zipper 2TM domain-containing protein [Rhodocyclaceae bacterium]